MLFEEFYEINLGVPEAGLPSFAYTVIDQFARVQDRAYGTIVPREPDSVSSYDPDTLANLLSEYLTGILNEHMVVDVVVIMKPDDLFREKSLVDYFDGKIAMLCVRGGLAVDIDGMPQTVYNPFPSGSVDDWDCAIINELVRGRNLGDSRQSLKMFKERFPSLMVGYEGPSVDSLPEEPEASFMEQGVEMVNSVLRSYGETPQSIVRSETKTIFMLNGGTEIRVSSNHISDRIAVTTGYGRTSTYRLDVERGERIVIEAVSKKIAPNGTHVGPRTYNGIIAEMLAVSSIAVDTSADGEGHLLRSSRVGRPDISLHLNGTKIVAEFSHKDSHYVATLSHSGDVDDFTEYLRSVLSNRYKLRAWSA